MPDHLLGLDESPAYLDDVLGRLTLQDEDLGCQCVQDLMLLCILFVGSIYTAVLLITLAERASKTLIRQAENVVNCR